MATCRHCAWRSLEDGDELERQIEMHELMHPGGTMREREDGRPAEYTRESALAALRDWVREHGRPPTEREWARSEDGHPGYQQVERLFGTWSKALMEASTGLLEIKRLLEIKPRWDRENAIEAIKAWAAEYGRPPISRQWARVTAEHPSAEQLKQLFGGWANAIEAAGFERPRRGGNGRPGGAGARQPAHVSFDAPAGFARAARAMLAIADGFAELSAALREAAEAGKL